MSKMDLDFLLMKLSVYWGRQPLNKLLQINKWVRCCNSWGRITGWVSGENIWEWGVVVIGNLAQSEDSRRPSVRKWCSVNGGECILWHVKFMQLEGKIIIVVVVVVISQGLLICSALSSLSRKQFSFSSFLLCGAIQGEVRSVLPFSLLKPSVIRS